MTYTYIAIFVYLAMVLGVGFYFSKRSSLSVGHFFIGNRALNYCVVALSAVVSGRSAWLILGVTGLAFTKGISAIWVIPGYTLVELALFLFVAPRLRQRTGKNGDVTITDFLVSELGDKFNLIRIFSVSVIVIFFISYVSAQLGAGHKTMLTLFGLESKSAGIIITAIIVGVYTVLGGYLAVCITDVIQAVFMIVGLVVLPIAAFFSYGGWEYFSQTLTTINYQTGSMFFLVGTLLGVVNGLSIGLGSPGQPHILVRYMSIDDEKKFKMASIMGTMWNILMGFGAVAIGILGRAIYNSADALPMGDKETLFLQLSLDTFHPFLAGLVIAALIAAIMSTVDSQILVIVSSLSRDLLQQIIYKDKKEHNFVSISKWIVVAVIVLSVILGIIATQVPGIKTVYSYVLLAWAALGAAFGPPIILTLFWKGMTKYGAMTSILAGPIFTVVFKLLRTQYPQAGIPYELLISFFLSLILCLLVSFCTKRS